MKAIPKTTTDGGLVEANCFPVASAVNGAGTEARIVDHVTAAYDLLSRALQDAADLAALQEEISLMEFDVADRRRVMRGLGAVARISAEKLESVEAAARVMRELVPR